MSSIYRKIPKTSPGAYIFQKPFLRVLFWEGFVYRGKLYVSKSATLIESELRKQQYTVTLLTAIILTNTKICMLGNYQVQAPRGGGGGLYSEGRFNGGFFTIRVWGPCKWRGLFSEFYVIPMQS